MKAPGPDPGLHYGLWLRAVCALAGLGAVGREALAARLVWAYRAGMSPSDAAGRLGAGTAERADILGRPPPRVHNGRTTEIATEIGT